MSNGITEFLSAFHEDDSVDLTNESKVALRTKIDAALVRLREMMADDAKSSKLHEVERMIARDVLAENRHLNCAGCLRLIQGLIDKANA